MSEDTPPPEKPADIPMLLTASEQQVVMSMREDLERQKDIPVIPGFTPGQCALAEALRWLANKEEYREPGFLKTLVSEFATVPDAVLLTVVKRIKLLETIADNVDAGIFYDMIEKARLCGMTDYMQAIQAAEREMPHGIWRCPDATILWEMVGSVQSTYRSPERRRPSVRSGQPPEVGVWIYDLSLSRDHLILEVSDGEYRKGRPEIILHYDGDAFIGLEIPNFNKQLARISYGDDEDEEEEDDDE